MSMLTDCAEIIMSVIKIIMTAFVTEYIYIFFFDSISIVILLGIMPIC